MKLVAETDATVTEVLITYTFGTWPSPGEVFVSVIEMLAFGVMGTSPKETVA